MCKKTFESIIYCRFENHNVIHLKIPEFDEKNYYTTDLQSLTYFNYNAKSRPDAPCEKCRKNNWETWHKIIRTGNFIVLSVVLHRQKIINNCGEIGVIMYKVKNVIINKLTSEAFSIAGKMHNFSRRRQFKRRVLLLLLTRLG